MRALLVLLACPLLAAASPDPAATASQSKAEVVAIPAGPALSRGALFHSLQGFRIPKGGLTAEITCPVSRSDGTLGACVGEGRTPAAALPAARRRLGPVKTLPTGTQPADPSPLLGRATVFLDPADYPSVTAEDALAARPIQLLPQSGGWAVQPEPGLIDRVYPDRGLRLEREARVIATCHIERDGSLACPLIVATPSAFGFERAASQVLDVFRAAPTLPDGRRSAGVWVEMLIEFRIA